MWNCWCCSGEWETEERDDGPETTERENGRGKKNRGRSEHWQSLSWSKMNTAVNESCFHFHSWSVDVVMFSVCCVMNVSYVHRPLLICIGFTQFNCHERQWQCPFCLLIISLQTLSLYCLTAESHMKEALNFDTFNWVALNYYCKNCTQQLSCMSSVVATKDIITHSKMFLIYNFFYIFSIYIFN